MSYTIWTWTVEKDIAIQTKFQSIGIPEFNQSCQNRRDAIIIKAEWTYFLFVTNSWWKLHYTVCDKICYDTRHFALRVWGKNKIGSVQKQLDFYDNGV
jgi:hypothetical protein